MHMQVAKVGVALGVGVRAVGAVVRHCREAYDRLARRDDRIGVAVVFLCLLAPGGFCRVVGAGDRQGEAEGQCSATNICCALNHAIVALICNRETVVGATSRHIA